MPLKNNTKLDGLLSQETALGFPDASGFPCLLPKQWL
jgi:hypothetical protein